MCVFSHVTKSPQSFRKRDKVYSSEEFPEFLDWLSFLDKLMDWCGRDSSIRLDKHFTLNLPERDGRNQ